MFERFISIHMIITNSNDDKFFSNIFFFSKSSIFLNLQIKIKKKIHWKVINLLDIGYCLNIKKQRITQDDYSYSSLRTYVSSFSNICFIIIKSRRRNIYIYYLFSIESVYNLICLINFHRLKQFILTIHCYLIYSNIFYTHV